MIKSHSNDAAQAPHHGADNAWVIKLIGSACAGGADRPRGRRGIAGPASLSVIFPLDYVPLLFFHKFAINKNLAKTACQDHDYSVILKNIYKMKRNAFTLHIRVG